MDWFKKIYAEEYGNGSKSIDFLSTEDGTETHQNNVDHPNPFDLSLGQGLGQQPDNGYQQHPISPDGEVAHNSDNSFQGRDEHATDDSARFTTMPFSEEGVDDNHNNNLGMAMASSNWIDPAQLKNWAENPEQTTTPLPSFIEPAQLKDWAENPPGPSQRNPGLDLWKADLDRRNNPQTSKSPLNKTPILDLFRKKSASQGQEADFFTSHVTGGPADSPQILDDGHADEELQRDQEGIKSTTNNFDTTSKNDTSMFQDPGIVSHEDDYQDIADINKGRVAKLNEILWSKPNNDLEGFNSNIISMNQFLLNKQIEKLAKYSWGDDSNVTDIMAPNQIQNDRTKKNHDYGTGDEGAGATDMSSSPLLDDTNPDTKNYSGFNNTAALFGIIMTTADYGSVMPSVNPNSGRDDDKDEVRPYSGDGQQIDLLDMPIMETGKEDFSDSENRADKSEFNPWDYHYDRVTYDNTNRAGDDDKDYYNVSGSGSGGTGMEGDTQNFSGVNNA